MSGKVIFMATSAGESSWALGEPTEQSALIDLLSMLAGLFSTRHQPTETKGWTAEWSVHWACACSYFLSKGVALRVKRWSVRMTSQNALQFLAVWALGFEGLVRGRQILLDSLRSDLLILRRLLKCPQGTSEQCKALYMNPKLFTG